MEDVWVRKDSLAFLEIGKTTVREGEFDELADH